MILVIIFIILGLFFCAVSSVGSSTPEPSPKPDTSEGSLDAEFERLQRAVRLVKECRSYNKSRRPRDPRIDLYEEHIDRIPLHNVAELMGISTMEARELLSEARDPSLEIIDAVEALDSNRINWLNELYPPSLTGKEKYLTEIKKELRELEERHKTLLAYSDCLATGSVYIPTKPKNVTLEAVKGQIIGGPGLAAAKAISAEKYNSNHPGGMPSSSEMQVAIELSVSKRMEADRLETKIKELKARVADIEARLIDMDNPEKYAKFVQCEFGNPRLTREGNIEVVIYGASKTNEEAMILDEPAIVDGSAIVKAWLNGKQIGESIYCPDGFDGNLERAGFEKGRSLGVYPFISSSFSLPSSSLSPESSSLKTSAPSPSPWSPRPSGPFKRTPQHRKPAPHVWFSCGAVL